jgi:PAS domain S-box-containing protein
LSGGPANETDRGDAEPDRDVGSAAAREQAAAARTINQRIFETSLDLILVVDRTGEFIRVSPSSLAILGYRPEEMIGRNAIAFILPDDLERTRNEMRMARRGRLMRNFESRYVHKEGRVVTLAWTGVWSEPEQQHFFIGRDMTERIAADERLAHGQRLEAIGQLTGGVAHDFNNLLGVVIGNLDLLHERLAADPESTELLDEALGAALRGADVTRQLLAFARRQPLHPQRVDVGELVSGLTKLLARTLGERIEISVDLAPDLWPVAVDPVQLEAALVNLATNARDAMPTGGRLTIAASNQPLDEDYASQSPEVEPGDYVMLRVGDTGAGMPREVLARIFEPFFTTKGRGQGTGLGLSMVFGFMKQSGGHINVYSEVGAGTIFRLYLPRDRSGAEAEERAVPEPASRGARETILVVEDNEAMRRLVARQLTELGYRVRQAASAEAALALIRGGEPIDLLFTDVVMAGKHDGFDLAQIVMTRWPRIKVVLTSGFPDAAGDAGVGLSGSIPLLSKPYRRDDLAHLLRDVLDRHDDPTRSV